jgi:DNA-binding HxlR family transcriptional regulator
MTAKPKISSRIVPGAGAARMVEDIVGCKWSLTVLGLVRSGVNRPGAMEHAVPGLSAKVLNERLRKLQRFGILSKRSYAEVPPRVEYSLTPFGAKFVGVLDGIERLERELGADPSRSAVRTRTACTPAGR